MITPADQAARDAVVERLDENMVVEAGAGTGKTSCLVGRIVALIRSGRARMGGVAAITFTEAAAGELRTRIGESLERAAADGGLGQEERANCERAMVELDQAAIQTLHSFAGSLLRERPLEAGLPPGFEIRDEFAAEIAFEERWSEWLDATLDDPDAQEALRPALLAGMTLEHIRKIAVSFHDNYDLLADASFSRPADRDVAKKGAAALIPVLQLLRRFALEYAEQRRNAGEVEFLDLLVLARNMLRDSLAARDQFRERFTHILIDEVQDTDPLQAEIAMFLAEEVPHGVNAADRPQAWHAVRPAAGKLFIVGDPKQSIYRFRRADIQQVVRMQEAVGGSKQLLSQNFRSRAPVIDWVNHLFTRWMEEGEAQASYSDLTPAPFQAEPPPVRCMGGEIEGNMPEVREQEAEVIANAIRMAIKEGWQVRSEDGNAELRPAKYNDICVLMPRRAGFNALEIAFEEAGIPYRLESASMIYETQEVRDLLNCLAAIDDPTDHVSVVAALRSPAFACSDADLLDFVEKGGQFDYLAGNGVPPGYVTEALAALKAFHEERKWTAPAALIERFVRERRLRELAFDEWQWRGRWMRYNFLIDRARAFAAAGETSLRAYIAWTARQREEQAKALETVVREADEGAVRVMTIHAAKGLEFPILFLAGLNATRSPSLGSVLFDRIGGRIEVRVGSGKTAQQTEGYEELAAIEREREEEERVRVMYVAATRARDHLVVSLYRNKRGGSSAAARIKEFISGADHLWQPFDPPEAAPDSPGPPRETATLDGDTPTARQRWIEERNAIYAARARPVAIAATRIAEDARDAKEEQDVPDEPWRRGRAGTSIGRAVHAALQVVDLRTGRGLDDIAQAQAAAEGVPDRAGEIARLVRGALESDLVQRALKSGRWWRETPVAGRVGGGIVDGFIDLLFEEEDGFVVVDYKTDDLKSDAAIEEAMARYRLQGGAYALALNRATGVKVKEVSFLFLNPSRARTVDDLSAAMMEAEEAALALLQGGPPDPATGLSQETAD